MHSRPRRATIVAALCATLIAAAILAGGAGGRTVPAPTTTSTHEHPVVAFDGANYFVVWEDDRRASQLDLYGGE